MANVAEQLVNEINERKETLVWWGAFASQYADLVKELEAADYTVRLTTTGLDVAGVGDREKLIAAFRSFRRYGFKTRARPEAKMTYFTTFFDHDTLKSVWFAFSSTVCQRVQVGTEMKEIPVWEVHCGQSMSVTEEDLS